MKIKSIRIQSYRSCIDTTFSIDRDLTALIGVNGSGKSNVLNALLLLKQLSNERYSPIDKSKANNKATITINLEYKGKPVKIKARIAYENDEDNEDIVISYTLMCDFSSIKSVPSSISISPEIINNRSWILNSKSIYKNIIQKYRNRKNSNQVTDENIYSILPVLDDVINYLKKISYYSASQFSNPGLCPNYIEIEEGRPIRRYGQTGSHSRFIYDLYQASKSRNKDQYQLYLQSVNSKGIGLVEDITFQQVEIASNSYRVAPGGALRTDEKSRLLIIPNFVINKTKLSPNQLSEGTFRTLALLFYILTDSNEVLLVEEPEVCVHHGLLNSIISLIKSQSKYKQIILSTHSEFVLDQLKPENIILVSMTNKGTQTKPLTDSMSTNEYIGLKNYLQKIGSLGDYWKENGFI